MCKIGILKNGLNVSTCIPWVVEYQIKTKHFAFPQNITQNNNNIYFSL